jgi:hypothetical protein
MAKIKVQNYSFDKTAKQVTFTDYTIDLAGVLLIVNQTYQNTIIYNFADSTKGGTAATNVLTLTYDTSSMANTDKLLIYYDDGFNASTTNVVNKASEQITDWTAVAQNVAAISSVLSCSAHESSMLHIQSFLDSTTAHTGTRFVIQTSSNTSGDEDWADYTEFVGLIGTADSEAITNNPLNAASTTITCASTTGYTAGAWRAIEDATLVNSELIWQKGLTANTNITILDGTTNSHVQNTVMYNIALSQVVMLARPVQRVRLVVDNTYTAAGSSVNYKIRISKSL